MQEYLFHGKRKDNGKWIEGSLSIAFGKYYICPEITSIFQRADGGVCLGSFIEVISDTVGQYTGEVDKNGRRIFEGSIVRYTKRLLDGADVPCINTVEYSKGGFIVDGFGLDNWYVDARRSIEVIGNIHDTPVCSPNITGCDTGDW